MVSNHKKIKVKRQKFIFNEFDWMAFDDLWFLCSMVGMSGTSLFCLEWVLCLLWLYQTWDVNKWFGSKPKSNGFVSGSLAEVLDPNTIMDEYNFDHYQLHPGCITKL